jgi:HAD superfamily hydrolase (TIGR01509 family)
VIDTEALWFEAERATTARYGGYLPDEAEVALLGVDTDTMLGLLRTRYGATADVETLRRAVLAELGGRLARSRALPGAAELVAAAAAAGVRCAVVSNSPGSVVEASLAAHPWARRLRVRVSADDAPRPKPAPDLYLLALERIELAPADCVALEDSPTGARAAVDAGLRCLGVTHSDEQAALLRAVTPHVLPSLSAARRWLGLGAADGGPADPGEIAG